MAVQYCSTCHQELGKSGVNCDECMVEILKDEEIQSALNNYFPQLELCKEEKRCCKCSRYFLEKDVEIVKKSDATTVFICHGCLKRIQKINILASSNKDKNQLTKCSHCTKVILKPDSLIFRTIDRDFCVCGDCFNKLTEDRNQVFKSPSACSTKSFLKDKINPQHYKQGSIECIDAIGAATVNKTGLEAACVANVIKYLWRYEQKNGLEDIKKAQWYLNKLISLKE